jgi:Protein of unknown function (DUF3500)
MTNNFRDMLPQSNTGRWQEIGKKDAYEHARLAKLVPHLVEVMAEWDRAYARPFVGVTTDGKPQTGLFKLADEGAPVASAAKAAHHLLQTLSDAERAKLVYPIDAGEWRAWLNPEFYIKQNGLRLEEIAPAAVEAVLALLKSSMSPAGYEKSLNCMRMNAFLGELIGAPKIMNALSYNISLFGEPSENKPWGWQLFGHHLALNCFFLGAQMVISPTFMGAEPNYIDAGPHAGLALFQDEDRLGLQLMRSLAPAQQSQAQIYKLMNDPAMPPGRWHRTDQRLFGGAFRDNQIVPVEGVSAGGLDTGKKDQIRKILAAFLEYLPAKSLAARLSDVEQHWDETYFSWIGSFGEEDPFYYRVQGPTLMVEFDHKSGVWLTNPEPAKCHIHTIVRTPNGNDYGKDLLRSHYAEVANGEHPGCSH